MSREEALCALLNTDEVVSSDAYPDELTLPEHIHTRGLEAVGLTREDLRERSASFRYRNREWESGALWRGNDWEVTESGDVNRNPHGNRLHTLSTVLFPPHIHLHTHPNMPDSMVDAKVTEAMAAENFEETDREPLTHSGRIILDSITALPSSGDIHRSLKGPLASIGHVLMSDQGSFAWVHKSIPTALSTLGQNTCNPRYQRLLRDSAAMRSYVDAADESILLFAHPSESFEDREEYLEDIHKDHVRIRSYALDPAYVCYLVEDPKNPTLRKIPSEAVAPVEV